MDMKLPVPFTDAKAILTVSTLHKLYHKNYFIDGLHFQVHILKISRLFQHRSTNSGLFGA